MSGNVEPFLDSSVLFRRTRETEVDDSIRVMRVAEFVKGMLV
jgi:hypothetical protein